MGYSNLTTAANYGQIATVKRLLATGTGTGIDEKDSSGDTALIEAAKGNHEKLVRWLIENGASIKLTNNNGATAESVAQGKNLNNIVKILQEAVQKPQLPIEAWIMMDKQEIAHAKSYPSTALGIMDVFNFKTRERVMITKTLGSETVSASAPQAFGTFEEDYLREAFNQLKEKGGSADESFVFQGTRKLQGKAPSLNA